MAAVTKDELAIGTKVTIKVKEQEMLGFIRFQGTTDFSEGDWVGIELEEPRGKNDGSVAEKRYFTCKPEHGLFVRPFHVLRIEDTKENGERNLRLELAEAVEENDDVAIERLLPEAEKKGVIEQELDLARSRLKSIRRSPIQVRELEEDTSEQGGQDVQENYEHMLERLLQQTQEKVRQGFAPKELDLARSLVKSMEMTAQGQQLAMAEAVKDQNEETIEQQLLEAEKTGAAEQEMKTSQRSPTTEPEAAGENYKDTLKWLLHEAKKKGLAEKELEMARSLLQSIERPKELQEPENEDTPLIDLLGGQDEIKKCRLMSQKIGQLVQDMVREGEAAAQQPYIYQGMGLEHMLELATGFKKTFDSLCHKLAEKVQGKEEFGGWKVSYMDAPIKSKASAESKVNTEYHGDCRQLKDVVRGTLVIDGNVDTTSIETVYKLLEQLVKSEELLRDANARFTRFSDRYQNPVGPSQYRDFLFLLKIGDFLCELQVNFKKAIDVKQNKQHKVYEKERMGTRKLLEAAMNKDENMVRILLSTDIDKGHLVSTRDCHGFTPLHYAARHGAIGILENLIDAGADVMAVDQEGLSPLYHSVMMQHLEASRKLLEQMSKRPKQDLRTPALQKTMQSIWGAIHFSERLRGLKVNACELAKRAFTTPARHVFGLAASGDVLAMKAARETLDEEYLGLGWFQTTTDVATGMRMLMLDWAIASGSAAMATLVRELGNSVSRFGDDLSMYSKKEEVQSLVSRGQKGRFRAYHAVRPILPQEMAEYLCLACEHQRLDMAYAIWTMASGDLKEVLNAEQKASLAELGGDAAATGHIEFVRLLIEAEVPLDHESKRNGKKMIRRAADNGQVQVIRHLAAAGASVEGSDLGAAASKGHLQAMKALIEAKADPNDRYGSAASDCPAGRAAMSNQSEALQLLRSRRVNIGTKELIALAKEKQSRECLAVMEEHRAETAT